MNASFYTAACGAKTQQEKLNVISNNFANINNYGYKSKTSVFQDLLYYNMRDPEGQVTNLTSGTGAKVSHTNTDFTGGGFGTAIGDYDYAIEGDGFFMVRDPATNDVSYTRNGHFSLSQRTDGFYLVTDANKLVLDSAGRPIRVENGEAQSRPGIYDFANKDGMRNTGYNEFVPVDKNGAAFLSTDSKLVENMLELSNVDMATEMANTVETSRAYSYVLKMVTTSDEIEQTINNLRG